jgi:ATP-binding cassette subfamily F protein 3
LAQQVLTEALTGYQGTILLVSHDRDVVSKVATSIISIDHGKVSYYPGTYDSFCYMRDQQASAATAASKSGKSAGSVAAPVVSMTEGQSLASLKKALVQIERELAKLDEAESVAVEALGDHEYGTPQYDKALTLYDQIKDKKNAVQASWEETFQAIEKQNTTGA